MEIRSTQKFAVESPKKLREVAFLLRTSGFTPVASLERLKMMNKRAAVLLGKVVATAVANAKQAGLNPEDLVFKEVLIGEGPRLRRFRAGSRGRAKPFKKRMSHVRIILTTKEVKKEVAAKADSEKAKVTENVETKTNKDAKADRSVKKTLRKEKKS